MHTWAQYLRDIGRSTNTVYEYERRVRLWKNYLEERGKRLDEAERADVIEWQRQLLREKNSARTINSKISAVSLYYEWLVITDGIDDNPVPTGMSLRGTVPRIQRLTDDELRDVLAYFDTLQANLRTAFWTMFGTGARVGEVAKLTYTDVKLVGGAVWIDIRDAKWGSDRTVPVVDDKAARVLYSYWLDQHPTGLPLFHVSKRTLQEYATNYAEISGLHFYSHLLRHTFAARMLEQGVAMTEIQYLLGHKSLSMTAHYTESALLDTSHLAPSIMQQYGNGGTKPQTTPRLRPIGDDDSGTNSTRRGELPA
ncbi:tyrosine-type recombinase/integrase [Lacticaseibacillus hegangensis]|uniref:Tyrosine-type recombinase/integrase n=1 Tax=Lacticaseibacillus hegangensis TaxID=2486010 RepID=A0ABW4CWB7_9LACO|nr:tyrosine-type recombinase/integrase [Lacticaseibacillus hegangensis]